MFECLIEEYNFLKSVLMVVAYRDKGSFVYNNGAGIFDEVEEMAKKYCQDHNITEKELDNNYRTFRERYYNANN